MRHARRIVMFNWVTADGYFAGPDGNLDWVVPDEEQAKAAGKQVKIGKFKLGGAGASVVYDDRAGLVKIVGDPEYGEILGAHIVGNIACDMISEVVNVMALEGGYPELARIFHPHPTMSEAILDGARAVEGWPIHA